MRSTLKVGIAVTALLGLGGCAGVPVVVSAASLYVDSILYLRTNKTSTDHILSAALDRDCAALHILTQGSLCKNAPPTPLIVEVMREVQNVPLNAPPPPPPMEVEVAEAIPALLTDATPAEGAAPLPPRKPAFDTPPQGSLAREAIQHGDRKFLVVVGSFAKREQAEGHRDRLGRPDADIVEATVRGRLYHRVVLPPGDRGEALRQLAAARAAGVGDAWLLPWSGRLEVGNALAALPYVGFLYRM